MGWASQLGNRGESAGPGLREVELGMPREFPLGRSKEMGDDGQVLVPNEQLKLGQGRVLQIDRYDIRHTR